MIIFLEEIKIQHSQASPFPWFSTSSLAVLLKDVKRATEFPLSFTAETPITLWATKGTPKGYQFPPYHQYHNWA